MAILSAKEQFCNLYNAANASLAKPLTVSDFTLSLAEDYVGPEGDLRNSEVVMTATPESPNFSGELTLHYTRRPVGFTGEQFLEGNPSDWEDDAYVLAWFNLDVQRQYLNDEFTAEDIQIARAENVTEGTYDVTITVMGHVRFQDAVITYMVFPTKINLATANGELNGFTE